MDELKWQDPPTVVKQSERVSRLALAAQLRSNPGKWALISAHATKGAAVTLACDVRKAYGPGFAPAGTFEATTVQNGNDWDVYARYIGPEEAA